MLLSATPSSAKIFCNSSASSSSSCVANAITEEPDPLMATPSKPGRRTPKAALHSRHKFLAIWLMQLVRQRVQERVQTFRKSRWQPAARCAATCGARQRAIGLGQNLSGLMRRNRNRWSYHHQADAFRKLRIQRHHWSMLLERPEPARHNRLLPHCRYGPQFLPPSAEFVPALPLCRYSERPAATRQLPLPHCCPAPR